jgi:hypothetical protein
MRELGNEVQALPVILSLQPNSRLVTCVRQASCSSALSLTFCCHAPTLGC